MDGGGAGGGGVATDYGEVEGGYVYGKATPDDEFVGVKHGTCCAESGGTESVVAGWAAARRLQSRGGDGLIDGVFKNAKLMSDPPHYIYKTPGCHTQKHISNTVRSYITSSMYYVYSL